MSDKAFDVEDIVGYKDVEGVPFWRVQWKGYVGKTDEVHIILQLLKKNMNKIHII